MKISRPTARGSYLGSLQFELPQLPSVIRYRDDFLDEDFVIHRPAETDLWKVSVGGTLTILHFDKFSIELRPLIKASCTFGFQKYSAGTACKYYQGLRTVSDSDLRILASSSPTTARATWQILTARRYSVSAMTSMKSIWYYLCAVALAGWSADYVDYLGTLPLPGVDKYAAVRTADCFLTVLEEAALIAHFDDISASVRQHSASVSDILLRDSAILVCSYQGAFRPEQIGMLMMRDVRIWTETGDPQPSVHLTFKMIKQPSSRKTLPMVRRVKREWACIFVELYSRLTNSGASGSDRLFGVTSARQVSAIIVRKTGELLPKSRSATELRHSAAQRLVDAGASLEEVAHFMGHSDLGSSLVYFAESQDQSKRLNAALGISEVYSQVVAIARSRFISADELAQLKGEQQIAGAPHGIPIAGIGGCEIGQPACPKNPIIACYGCYKFMPINDPAIHREALSVFRTIVLSFAGASRGDANSPTYLQLKAPIARCQATIAELEETRV